MVAYDDNIFFDTEKMMDQMSKYLEVLSKEGAKNGIALKFEQRKLRSFSEVNEKIIINSSGLGSTELDEDDQMVSVQGHLIMLKDQVPEDIDYMILISLKHGKTKSGLNVMRSFDLFPKKLLNSGANDVGVLGGTYIEHGNEDDPNEEEFETIVSEARDFFGITDLKSDL
jgi:D-amino-acid oxidase